MRSIGRYAVLFFLLLASVARAAETEIQYLSGLGKDDPVKWEFICDKGQNANKWSTIGVPSNWELQGFGIYGYGYNGEGRRRDASGCQTPGGWILGRRAVQSRLGGNECKAVLGRSRDSR